jgi:RNA polymerase sigma factor (sigma-70 family)
MANHAHLGLWKAVQHYQGNSSFHHYANFYIQGELYEGLSLLYPICKVSKNERKKKKHTTEHTMTTYLSRREYKRKLNTHFVGNNEWIFDKYGEGLNHRKLLPLEKGQEKEFLYESWKSIHSLSPFQKRVFQLKYNAEWEKIRSNREVALLMACSEEHIRKTLTKWHQA